MVPSEVHQIPIDHVRAVSGRFAFDADYVDGRPCGAGHINDTFELRFRRDDRPVRYILQRINHHVFPNPVALMRNIERVTAHLRNKVAAAGNRALTLIPTREGECCCRDAAGYYWRAYVFLEGVRSHDVVETPEQAYQAGRAFGQFLVQLMDLKGERLTETIPQFHNTALRFARLEHAIAEDAHNRARLARAEIDIALRHKPMVDLLLNAHSAGDIPERVIHNDTKFNNVMLDETTGEAMCVIDLDTVMPGLVHYDFGDMVRTTTSRSREDETDLSKINVEMPMFQALARGYLSAAGPFLTAAERSYLAFSGKLITFTIGIRFLTDFLSGDTYFRIHRPNHNFDRARSQFRLVESIEFHERAMQKFIDRI